MNRLKKHKMKKEKPEASTSFKKEKPEYDLAYYIHDRVELMHQVFSVLKAKDIKAMAPACVRNISADDLQELCTEELLGISSKRLCAILDGGEPPSDTESSSGSPSLELETISLDSISSDEDILSETSSSKKRKHKHRRRAKGKKKKGHEDVGVGGAGGAGAGGGGLTVLELLELQARARAIRAQLHCERVNKQASESAVVEERSPSDNEVEIKEESLEVVEISSEDEKPNLEQLQLAVPPSTSQEPTPQEYTPTTAVTKRVNDLIITVPQPKMTRKIKLNRNKTSVTMPPVEKVASEEKTNITEAKEKVKKKKKDKKKKKAKDGSDHDEITLQLSDSEKMDLLEDFERQHFDSVSSSEDSESSSSDSEDEDANTSNKSVKDKKEVKSSAENISLENVESTKQTVVSSNNGPETSNAASPNKEPEDDKKHANKDQDSIETSKTDGNEINNHIASDNTELVAVNNVSIEETTQTSVNNESPEQISQTNAPEAVGDVLEISSINQIPLIEDINDNNKPDNTQSKLEVNESAEKTDGEQVSEIVAVTEKSDKNLSEGELSDEESSEVEATDLKPEVICISDDEKQKKTKKEKKKAKKKSKEISEDILELSDDSSCYEVAGTVLSKEPTAQEIEALSAKIDEIEREEVITEAEIQQYESLQAENVSWKDRYLDSTKVKRVLSTANILNALRKKNKELKKSIAKIKLVEVPKEPTPEPQRVEGLHEGTIEHYNMLQGSTKYVDPVEEQTENNKEVTVDGDENKDGGAKVTNEMKKDAKQLLKMYKKLLKYNDMNKQKDPSKKKKKKAKKNKTKDKNEASSVAVTENI